MLKVVIKSDCIGMEADYWINGSRNEKKKIIIDFN